MFDTVCSLDCGLINNMKHLTVSIFCIVLFCNSLSAQEKKLPDSLRPLIGYYQPGVSESNRFRIKWEEGQLILEVAGQGQTTMEPQGGRKYKPAHVNPDCIVEFVADDKGQVYKFLWRQDTHLEWTRAQDSITHADDSLAPYSGKYKLKGSAYTRANIQPESGKLYFQATGEDKLQLEKTGTDQFLYAKNEMRLTFSFRRSKKGDIQKLITDRTGGVDFMKLPDSITAGMQPEHISNRQNGFTHADTLRGMLSPLRSCYDVTFYHLDITVNPESKSIEGNNLIRFRVLQPFDRMQIDLYANMKIEKITWKEQQLSFTRDADAVFIQLPEKLAQGNLEEISIFYAGVPQVPDLSVPMKGGILWLQDQWGKAWIESVCQGSGASLWWPCKDHLSDKPDSMAISVTVPEGMTDISNGRLLRKSTTSNHLTRFDWYVSNPIVNYDVVMNIGNYQHFSDTYVRAKDTLTMDYYCMPYSLEKAKLLFRNVVPMLQRYEKYFGPYPFPQDGFTLLEAPYPMEHQSAVSVGSLDNYYGDSLELKRLMWHECAHEWWGNSVTCSDMAEFWLHEAFATYAEYLSREAIYGKEDAEKEINKQKPANKEPMTGVYNVNHIHYDIGDLYSKGSLMLNTLRHVIDNDSLWFGMLRGIQSVFRYRSVTADEIIGYINKQSGADYNYFFEQYLHQASIPNLELKLSQDRQDVVVQYRWTQVTDDFHMPIKVSRSKSSLQRIEPTTTWQSMRIANMQASEFKVDDQEFLVNHVVLKTN